MKKLDLHGFTLEEAFEEFTDFIYQSYTDNLPAVEIITGKSGQIRKESNKVVTPNVIEVVI